MKSTAPHREQPLLANLPDYQAVFLWEYVRFVEELLDYTLGLYGGPGYGNPVRPQNPD
jgi:hypothetical protein